MDVSLFDYHLPPERIAQRSAEPRDHARLLIVPRRQGPFLDKRIYDLPSYVNPGDVLIFNDTKVFRARLEAQKGDVRIELFLLHPEQHTHWIALVKPARKIHIQDELMLHDQRIVTVLKKRDDGTVVIDTHRSIEDMFAYAEAYGSVPVPPYVVPSEQNTTSYQTIYARERGSVAAPTAGFHITPTLLKALKEKGAICAFITLHVGLGTFRPIKTTTLETHDMHEEWGHVPQETVDAIKRAKTNGHRIIAIGTTTVRALESMANATSEMVAWSGRTRLFITPGYRFRVIDGLLTNFHLPKSTLLVLVSAFAQRERILEAYHHAIQHEYRFYSFGDAMLII